MYSRSAVGIAAALLLVLFAAHTNANCVDGQIGYPDAGRPVDSVYDVPGYPGQFNVLIGTPWGCNKVGVTAKVCDGDNQLISVVMASMEVAVVTRGARARHPARAYITVYCRQMDVASDDEKD